MGTKSEAEIQFLTRFSFVMLMLKSVTRQICPTDHYKGTGTGKVASKNDRGREWVKWHSFRMHFLEGVFYSLNYCRPFSLNYRSVRAKSLKTMKTTLISMRKNVGGIDFGR